MADDLEERVSKLKQEIDDIVKKINNKLDNFDMENDSIEEIAQYEILMENLRERGSDLMDEIEIEILLETVNQSLVDEGYIT